MKYFKRSHREELYIRRIIKQRKEIITLRNELIMIKLHNSYEKGIISAESILTILKKQMGD